jgi:hypothetical protein
MRKVPLLLTAAALPAAFLIQSVSAQPMDRSSGSSATVGRLAYIAPSGRLKLATIGADGAVTSSRTIGPVNTAPQGGTVTVFDPVVSAGGGWVAWTEEVQTRTSGSSWIVLRRHGDGHPEKINTDKTNASPIGFVGQHLAVGAYGNAGEAWVVRTGTHPHLKLIAKSRKDTTLFATDKVGIIYERGFGLQGKPEHIDLLTLSGHSSTLHTFPGSMFKGEHAPLEQGWADPDGIEVVFEQGDHTDFGGVGPTSKAFAISGLHASDAVGLGHPGASSPTRRMEGTSFGADTPYSVWATVNAQLPAGSIYSDDGHGWHVFAKHSLVVAGNSAGDVITQPAKYVSVGGGAPDYDIKPTGDAVLYAGGARHTVPLRATEMVWL